MTESRKLWLDLTEQELGVLESLREEMGVTNMEEVMHALIRQAHKRAEIVCPACGHAAQVTAEDEARCDACMSVLRISDQIWQVVVTRSAEA